MQGARYDTIGVGYARYRRADPRIAAPITEALGGASPVLNVGAGTGSYEPIDRPLVALEPSEVMVEQRPAAAPPAVRGHAEHLPFPDRSFAAALAVITLHHWSDPVAGLAEMVRVAERRVVLTFDPSLHASLWLFEYLPEARPLATAVLEVDEVAGVLGSDGSAVRVEQVPVPADCVDGFNWAYWRRPECYLDPEARAAISGLALMRPEELTRGLGRLAADVTSGRWHDRHADLLQHDRIDGGFRLVVAG